MEEVINSLLQNLESEKNLRKLTTKTTQGSHIQIPDVKTPLLNLSSNDYLCITNDKCLLEEFFKTHENLILGSTGSRSLTGNHIFFQDLENTLKDLFSKKSSYELSALCFNSAYQANLGIMDCLGKLPQTLFLVDEFSHASIFDGLRISKSRFFRFPHQEYGVVKNLLEQHHKHYKNIIIISEGIFSMTGRICELKKLYALKNSFGAYLYLDESHSLGTYGEDGLGISHLKHIREYNVDFLILGFGKALGSIGGAIICKESIKNYLINKARTLIYSTALPPINIAWTKFVLTKLKLLSNKRTHLLSMASLLRKTLKKLEIPFIGNSHIMGILTQTNSQADKLMLELQKEQIFCPSIKSPTTKTPQIRISLNASLHEQDILNIAYVLNCKKHLISDSTQIQNTTRI